MKDKEILNEFYVIQVKTDKIKNHIVSLEDGAKIRELRISSKPDDKLEIRNGVVQAKYIINIFKSYNHKPC